ncbi:flagellin [Devosia elaeis]|uniref:Flagellin n=1 Tax=Devosia elaeis TaxID=1770058 RepID=A0A178I3C1_9HYPH|nr:flagellin [Devosia elaeis]OAM78756.1 hypothetical protein A3840_05360 [Devosia elaeis]
MGDISLSKAVRSNLLSLQNTSAMMAKTQERLATGNKVNSALDNPTNFFTAAGLNSRAGDLNQLMDSMANGIQTLEAADNGLTAITKTLESMQSTLRQARQDKSFQTQSFTIDNSTASVSFSGGAFASDVSDVGPLAVTGGTYAEPAADVTLSLTSANLNGGDALDVTIETGATMEEAMASINTALKAADGGKGFTARLNSDGDGIEIVSKYGEALSVQADVAGTGFATTATDATAPTSASVDDLVTAINGNSNTKGLVRASNDNGKLRIENLSTQDLDVTVGTANAATIDGNSVRAGLADQYNELRDQLDKLADDASFNGINLLRGDKLTITFNETGTSSIDINTKGEEAINSANLGIETFMQQATLDSDTNIDNELARLKGALNSVRSQSSSFGSNLSIVQNRQDFTKNMVNTLQTGAANLTLADMNEEAANLLALQTRQSLSSNSLSLASQADQSVLQLIR